MRLVRLALSLLVVALLAGCSEDAPPTTVTPESPTPEAPTPTSPTPAMPSPSPAPDAPTAATVYERTFDFSTEGDATGNAPKQEAFAVGDGYTKLTLAVNWTQTGDSAGAPPISLSAGELQVALLGPDGGVLATCDLDADAPSGCEAPADAAGAGEYAVRYSGAGNHEAAVTVVAS